MSSDRTTPPLTTRRCLTVYQPGEADTGTVAALLQAAARQLIDLESATVHHVQLDTVDDARRSELVLTVYLAGDIASG